MVPKRDWITGERGRGRGSYPEGGSCMGTNSDIEDEVK